MKKSNVLKGKFETHKLALNAVVAKRILILMIIGLIFSGKLFSQIGYTSSRLTGVTYTSITSGTNFASWRNGSNTDDNLSASTAIGFNFFYDGAVRTTFSASTNGFITFNTGTTATGNGSGAYGYYNPAFSLTSNTTQALAPIYYDLQTLGSPNTTASLAASIKYKLTGASPNRILTIEWKTMQVYASSGPSLNFQIKLYETSNKIEFLYGTMTASTASYSYTTGLNSLTVSSIPATTELYTQQIVNTATFSNISSNSLATIPTTNSKLTFTPISTCSGTPTAGTSTAAVSSFCTSGSTLITLSGYSAGVSGITFQWQNSTDGGVTWNDIVGATAVSYTTPTISITTKYRCAVKCTSSGLTSTSTISTVTINSAPVINCPSAISVMAAAGSCNAIVSYAATASGSPAPVITYSINPGSIFSAGTSTVVATATNSCGAVSCSFTVTVTATSTNYWLGSVSSDWFNSANWCSGVPNYATNVQIPSGATHMPLITAIGASCKDLTINSGASLTMNGGGNLTVTGNWSNSGTFTATAGGVVFLGSSLQSITGATTFHELTINNSLGLLLNNNISINSIAHLELGTITTGTNVVTINNGASLIPTNGYVNGYLKKYIEAGLGTSQLFEVGTATAYSPIAINFNNVLVAGMITLNSVATDHPLISSSGLNVSKTINRYWNITNSGVSFDFYDIDLNYVSTDKDLGFIEMYSGAKLVSASGIWSTLSLNYNSPDFISLINVTSFGAIQVGVFNPVPLAFSITPDYGYNGQTLNIQFSGKGFISGVTSITSAAGITVNSTTINNDSLLTANVSISSSASIGIRKIAIQNGLPFGGISDSLTFTVRTMPHANFFANRTTIVCNASGNVEFNNYSTGASSYFWDFGPGAIPATATGSGPYTVTYSTTGFKTVKLIAFSPIGNDTLIRVNNINVTSSAPAKATSITGLTNVCASGTSTVVYNAPLLTDVIYNWTVPTNATIVSGQGTRSLLVSFSAAFTSGNISLTQTNGCGTSAAKLLAVSKAPSTPASVLGTTVICGLTSVTYSVSATAGAVSYSWTLPAGVTSTVGTSPITTTGTSLTVQFASTFNAGNLKVVANGPCASSAAKTLALRKAPGTPGIISGATNVCGISSATYSIAAVAGATSYIWTLPSGITSSTGSSVVTTSSNSITVNFSTTFTTGTISVKASNSCASSAARTLALSGCMSYTAFPSNDTLLSNNLEMNLYPNPSIGNFNLSFAAKIDSDLQIEIIDSQGRKKSIETRVVVEGENQFNFNYQELQKGMYFLRLLDEKNQINKTMTLVIQ